MLSFAMMAHLEGSSEASVAMMTSRCPLCTSPQIGHFRFCRSCGFDFEVGVHTPAERIETRPGLERLAPPSAGDVGKRRLTYADPGASTQDDRAHGTADISSPSRTLVAPWSEQEDSGAGARIGALLGVIFGVIAWAEFAGESGPLGFAGVTAFAATVGMVAGSRLALTASLHARRRVSRSRRSRSQDAKE